MTTAIVPFRRVTKSDRMEAARCFIADHPNTGVPQLTAHLGITNNHTRVLLTALVDEGHVVRVRRGAYMVAPQGQPVAGAVEQAAMTGDRRVLLEAVLIRLARQADRTTRDAGLAAVVRQLVAVSAEIDRIGGAAGDLPILAELAERRRRRALAGDPVVVDPTQYRGRLA